MKMSATWVRLLWLLLVAMTTYGGVLETVDTCQKDFNIQYHSASGREYQIFETPVNKCQRKPKSSATSIETHPYYEPDVTFGKVGEDFVANITWIPQRIAGRIPRTFYLLLEAVVNGATNQAKCVKLKFAKELKESNVTEMFYDCIKLVKDSTPTTLYVQLMSRREITSSNCRSRRSSGRSDGRCVTMETCTRKVPFSLSLDDYKYDICRCGKPGGNVTAGTEHGGYVNATINHVPPYTRRLEVLLKGLSSTDQMVRKEFRIRPEADKPVIVTWRNLTAGEYQVEVHVECEGTEPPIGGHCRSAHGWIIPQKVNVPKKLVPIATPFDGSFKVWIPLCVLVIVIGVTCAVFVVLKCRRQAGREGPFSATDLLPPELSRNKKELRCRKVLQNIAPRHQENKTITMVLDHPDTDAHRDVLKIFKELMSAMGIPFHSSEDIGAQQSSNTLGNWRDFAEDAGKKYVHVVLAMSEKLYSLCHEYKQSNPLEAEEYSKLLEERGHEFVPCVAMDTLRTLYQNRAQQDGFLVHLVSFGYKNETDVDFTDLFLKDHLPCLNKSNCLFYRLAEISTTDTASSAVINTSHFPVFLKYLSGGEEVGVEHLDRIKHFTDGEQCSRLKDAIERANTKRPVETESQSAPSGRNNHREQRTQHTAPECRNRTQFQCAGLRGQSCADVPSEKQLLVTENPIYDKQLEEWL